MKRSQRLAVVQKLIDQQEQQMARALGMARQQLDAEENKKNELVAYLDSYEDELKAKSGEGVSGAHWQNYQFFIGQLEEVIAQQDRTIIRAQHQVKVVMDQWQKVNIKKKSMNSLIDNIKLEELVEQDKKDQKMIDDLVNQMMAQR